MLGTDGFGRSEARQELRRFFEVDAENIALAALGRAGPSGPVSPGEARRRRSRPWASTRTSRTRPRPVEGFCERRYTTHDANRIAVEGTCIEFKLPELGENIASGDVVNVLVHEGEEIAANQGVVELETEKAVVEIPCPHAGKVVKIQVKKAIRSRVGKSC